MTDEQQARSIVRASLVLAGLDLDRANLFLFNDVDRPSVHGSSSLTRGGRPEPSFHAVAQIQRLLGDHRFVRLALDRPGDVLAAEFAHGSDPRRRAWEIRSLTSTDRTTRLRLDALPTADLPRCPFR